MANDSLAEVMKKISKKYGDNVVRVGAQDLTVDGGSFSYTEEDGIVFTAPESYVMRLIRRLMSCYGCSVRPKINEVK